MYSTINFDSVADIYDLYVNTNLDVEFFVNECSKASGDVLELMCGTGRISIPLLENGIRLTCVDYMGKMLDVFKDKVIGKNYNVKIVEMDVSKLYLKKKYNLIILPFNSFSEILDTENQISALKKIFEHLNPDGKFICTLHNPIKRLKTADGKTYEIGKYETKNNKVLRVSYKNNFDKDSGVVFGKQYYELYDGNNLVEKKELDISFRLFEKREFEEMITGTGFKVENIYGNYDYSEFKENESPFMIWILKK